MGSVNVHIDMREYTGKIRQKVTNMYIESVSKPGVKTEIYTTLYNAIVDSIPEDTGALKYSPLTGGSAESMGFSNKKRYKNFEHFAQGDITDSGIYFDPYSINKRGTVEHYANKVDNFKPHKYINDRRSMAYEAIKNILVKEMNNNGK